MTVGACVVTDGTSCFTSPNFPSNYGDGRSCTIMVGANVSLVVQSFDTSSYDYLTVNGVKYSGNIEYNSYAHDCTYNNICLADITGTVVRAGDVISWSSDGVGNDVSMPYVSASGFRICSAGTCICVVCAALVPGSSLRDVINLCVLSLLRTEWVGYDTQTRRMLLPLLLRSKTQKSSP